MQRAIVGFRQDETGAWVAELGCGHSQHVRHEPPWQNRPWVTSEQGRCAQLGTPLDCGYCEMAELPASVRPYKQTQAFTEASVPAALLSEHKTKPGVWAQIVVEAGKLEYRCTRGVFVLRAGVNGIVEPESPHQVRPLQQVRFHVLFLRASRDESA